MNSFQTTAAARISAIQKASTGTETKQSTIELPATKPGTESSLSSVGPESGKPPGPFGVNPAFALWHVMPVSEDVASFAERMVLLCACSDLLAPNPHWRPSASWSPYVVLCAPFTIAGLQATQRVAGGLRRRMVDQPTISPLAAVLLSTGEPVTRPQRELLAATEATGLSISLVDETDLHSGGHPWSPLDPNQEPSWYQQIFTTWFLHIRKEINQ